MNAAFLKALAFCDCACSTGFFILGLTDAESEALELVEDMLGVLAATNEPGLENGDATILVKNRRPITIPLATLLNSPAFLFFCCAADAESVDADELELVEDVLDVDDGAVLDVLAPFVPLPFGKITSTTVFATPQSELMTWFVEDKDACLGSSVSGVKSTLNGESWIAVSVVSMLDVLESDEEEPDAAEDECSILVVVGAGVDVGGGGRIEDTVEELDEEDELVTGGIGTGVGVVLGGA